MCIILDWVIGQLSPGYKVLYASLDKYKWPLRELSGLILLCWEEDTTKLCQWHPSTMDIYISSFKIWPGCSPSLGVESFWLGQTTIWHGANGRSCHRSKNLVQTSQCQSRVKAAHNSNTSARYYPQWYLSSGLVDNISIVIPRFRLLEPPRQRYDHRRGLGARKPALRHQMENSLRDQISRGTLE